MRYSHSSVDCFEKCKQKFKMRYLQGITTIPATEPDNPLILGQAVHTGIEKGLEETIRDYCFSFPIITDEHINEIIKFETVIPLAKTAIPPGGKFEVEIKDDNFMYQAISNLTNFTFINTFGNATTLKRKSVICISYSFQRYLSGRRKQKPCKNSGNA